MQLPKKKKAHEIDLTLLKEPGLNPHQQKAFLRGAALFNKKKFWDAHEAWEEVWKECSEESRIFFQGIIQAAAAYHLLLVKRRYGGMMNNFDKALSKLDLFPPRFLGIDVEALRQAIVESKRISEQLGPERLIKYPMGKIPKL